MITYIITLGDGKQVTMRQYLDAIATAKAHPQDTFKRSLTSAWIPTTGAAILAEFRRYMVTDHCNRGLTIQPTRDPSHYILRRIQAGKLSRECKWCGSTFTPTTVNELFDDPGCQRSYYGG